MPNLPTLVLVLLGVVLLVIFLVRVIFAVRRVSVAGRLLTTRLGEGLGVLRARLAAVKVSFDQLRRDGGADLDRTATAGSIEHQR